MTDRAVSFSLPSSRRLKKQREFDAVFRSGRALKGELVRICYLYRDGGTLAGVTVGKKIAGAVARARGRRILRESIRRLLPWLREGIWLVASLRGKGLDSNAVSVYYEMAGLLEKSGMLTDEWNGADWRADDPRISRETPRSRQ
ncbi:MAG: ribonuclease P protein component [Synergistaceae bacterium]|jgi:ribonuclease P protein component|nr:ribonuclease P protein component [Synergistaceae bacterium]